MENLRRLWVFISSPNYSRTLAILAFLVLAAAVPLTVYISQQRQEIRQRAAEQTYLVYVCGGGGVQYRTCTGTSCPDWTQLSGVVCTFGCTNGTPAVIVNGVWLGQTSASCNETPPPSATPVTTTTTAPPPPTTAPPSPTSALVTCYVCGSNGWRLRGNTGVCPSATPPTCQVDNDNDGLGCILGPGMQAGGTCALPTGAATPTSLPTPTGGPPLTGSPPPTLPPLAADFDRNGCVGSADFEIWRVCFQTGIIRQGTSPDTNNNGRCDLLDFAFWSNAMISLPLNRLCQ